MIEFFTRYFTSAANNAPKPIVQPPKEEWTYKSYKEAIEEFYLRFREIRHHPQKTFSASYLVEMIQDFDKLFKLHQEHLKLRDECAQAQSFYVFAYERFIQKMTYNFGTQEQMLAIREKLVEKLSQSLNQTTPPQSPAHSNQPIPKNPGLAPKRLEF